jgi:hypothetical protein
MRKKMPEARVAKDASELVQPGKMCRWIDQYLQENGMLDELKDILHLSFQCAFKLRASRETNKVHDYNETVATNQQLAH